RLLARRIEQADQAEQNERLGQVGRTETAGLDVWILQPCHRQHALALGSEPVRGLHEMRAIERLCLAAGSLLAIAVLENNLRGAIAEQNLLPRGRLVERRHEIVL